MPFFSSANVIVPFHIVLNDLGEKFLYRDTAVSRFFEKGIRLGLWDIDFVFQ
jgi:hypothetical protein